MQPSSVRVQSAFNLLWHLCYQRWFWNRRQTPLTIFSWLTYCRRLHKLNVKDFFIFTVAVGSFYKQQGQLNCCKRGRRRFSIIFQYPHRLWTISIFLFTLLQLIANPWDRWTCHSRGKRSFLLVCPDSGVLTPVCGCFNLCFFLLCPPYLCCVWWLFGMVTGGRFLIAVGSS